MSKRLERCLKHCRVCGLEQADAPWAGTNQQLPSYDICSCCGAEFGIDDDFIGNVAAYRQRWLSGEHDWMTKPLDWLSPEKRPANWDVEDQLARIPEEFQFTAAVRSFADLVRFLDSGDLEKLRRARIADDVWFVALREDPVRYSRLAAGLEMVSIDVREKVIALGDTQALEKLAVRERLTESEREAIRQKLDAE